MLRPEGLRGSSTTPEGVHPWELWRQPYGELEALVSAPTVQCELCSRTHASTGGCGVRTRVCCPTPIPPGSMRVRLPCFLIHHTGGTSCRITVQGASHEASRAQAAATPATPATEPAAAASIAFLPASVPTQSSAGPTDDIRFHAQLHVPGDAADSSIHTPTGGTRSAESGANDGAAIGAAIAGGLMHGAHASAVELAVVSAGDPAATAAVSTDTGLSEATAYTRHSGRTEGSGGELAAPHPAATIAVPVTPFTPHRGSLVMGVRCLDSGQLQQSQEVVAQRQGRQQQQQGGQPHAVGAQHAGVAGAPSCDGTTSGDCGTLTPIMTTITATAAALASSTSSMTAPLSGSTDAKPASAGPESGSGPASSGPGIAAAAVAAGRGGAAVEHTATCSSTSWLACSSTMSTAGASSTKQQHEDAALNSGGMQVSGAGGGGAAAAPTGTPGASPAPSSGSADDGLVVLTNVLLGKGSYGRVVEGRYGGQRVAVKLVAPVSGDSCGESIAGGSLRSTAEPHILAFGVCPIGCRPLKRAFSAPVWAAAALPISCCFGTRSSVPGAACVVQLL